MESLYGNYRNKKFTDVFEDLNTFATEYANNGIETTITNDSISTLYYLLYARYGNSTIVSSDVNQWKYKVWSIIFQYGPTWEKRLEVQEALRDLSETDLITGSKSINNHSYNPSTDPGTSSLEELTTINEQNTQSFKKSKLDGYAMLIALLKSDVTEEFLRKFEKLFITIVEPEEPLWYIEEN